MKKRLMISALMLAMATMVMPGSASAAIQLFYTEVSWESAVASFADVTMPAGNYTNQEISLPSGGGDIMIFNQSLTKTGDFYYTSDFGSYHADGSFLHRNPDYSYSTLYVNEFGFQLNNSGSTNLLITYYTAATGTVDLNVAVGGTNFIGWIADAGTNVQTFSTWSTSSYGIGKLEQGFGVAPVPESSTLLLLGSGLAGLFGYGRRRFKK